MKVFVDSSDPKEIATAQSWGAIDGVTTNPTLISRAGNDMQKTLDKIIEVSPGPVLCQVVGSEDKASLVAQAKWLRRRSPKIVVKLPMSIAGIQALIELKGDEPTMEIAVTTVASIAQAYMVGKAGADIVALFNGPLDQEIDQPVDLVGPVRQVYDNYGFATKILSCGRYPRAFGQFAIAGTDICTLRFDFLRLLYEHPYTDKRIRNFAADWRRVFGETAWSGDEGCHE